MENKKSVINQYLLRFDFSSKVIFILTLCILSALILYCSIIVTYHGLSNMLQNQIIGISFFDRSILVYHNILDFQSDLNHLSKGKKMDLEAEMATIDSIFSLIIQDLRLHIKNTQLQKLSFYQHQMKEIEDKMHNLMFTIQQDGLNEELSNLELKNYLIDLKQELLSFLDLIIQIFNLQLFTNKTTGLHLDLFLHRLPAFQDVLSQFLSLNLVPFNFLVKAQVFEEQKEMEESLKFFLSSNEIFLDQGAPLQKQNNSLTLFVNSAIKLSNFISIKMYQEEALKESWRNLHALGLDVLEKSKKLHSYLSQSLIHSLNSEIHIYYLRELYSTFLFFLGVCFVMIPYLTQGFRRPLVNLKDAAEKLTDGNLSIRIPIIQADEVGEISKSFNETAEIFEKIMLETDRFATFLSEYSSEIFSTAKKLEQNLTIEEVTVQNITQNSKNIRQTVLDFSNHLNQVNETVLLTADEVYLSQMSLSDLEMIMKRMASAAENTVLALSTVKSEIDKITIVINTLVNIADQISLLSLNTIIRANNTGLKKLGFTVIADKISELANQTAYATLDMEENVQQILSVVPEIVKDIDQFGFEIQGALSDSVVIRDQFQQLFSILQNQITSFLRINHDMQEQAGKTADINKAVTDLSLSAKKTTNSVRSLYVEIEYLHLSTKNLLDMTKSFTESSKNKN